MSKYRFSIAEKFAVFKILGPKCIWCLEPIFYQECELDHVIPESLYKKTKDYQMVLQKFQLPTTFNVNSFYNFGPIHNHCNQSKSNKVYEGAPFIGDILYRIRNRVPEIEKIHAEFLRKQKGANTIAQIEDALAKKVVSKKEIEDILQNRNVNRHSARTKVHEIFKCKLIPQNHKGRYGKVSPKQLYDVSYDLFHSEKRNLVEFNSLISAQAVQELISARENYYNYLKVVDSNDAFFKSDSSHNFWMGYTFISSKFLSYSSTVRFYMTGAAHDQYNIKGHSYYLNPLRPFSLSSVLINYKAFIEIIAPLAYDKMLMEIKEREPDIEITDYYPIEKTWLLNEKYNPFSNYYFTKDSLTFIFNPYEISAWVFGAHFPSFLFSELINFFPGEKEFIQLIRSFKNNNN